MSRRLVRSSLKGCPAPVARLRLVLCRRFCSYWAYFWCICWFRVLNSCRVRPVNVLKCVGCLDSVV